MFFIGIFGSFLAPYPSRASDEIPGAFAPFYKGDVRKPPSWIDPEEPWWKYLFGTNPIGTDVFSEVIHGTKYTIYVGILVTFITMALSIVIGAIAGFYGRWVDTILMRVAEVFLVFPSLLFILVFVRIFTLRVGEPFSALPIINIKIPTGLTIVILIQAVPIPDPKTRRMKIVLPGEVPSPINPPKGCRFKPRCPFAEECQKDTSKLVDVGGGHLVACQRASVQ